MKDNVSLLESWKKFQHFSEMILMVSNLPDLFLEDKTRCEHYRVSLGSYGQCCNFKETTKIYIILFNFFLRLSFCSSSKPKWKNSLWVGDFKVEYNRWIIPYSVLRRSCWEAFISFT